ncbi:hypothetical protein dqs_2604 [Azoarcus olearius]|uniref:hypothetical protein n=1 Tax=Azoarcus sp. (strain BH72) TaxID=418699 RepID=UPI00080639A5|nr:hypothetical protein [Azoarcus olearius]ANQ85634.1 hypothetical protein dqs_2604 [Azoarcus olearius]
MDRFDTDVMDDLFDEAAEGPARHADDYDDYEDASDDWDGGDEGDEFTGRIAGGPAAYDDYDEDMGIDAIDDYEGMDEWDAGDDAGDYDGYDSIDALDDAVADALDAADGDEFFRRLRRLASGAMNVARQVGRGVGAAARVIGPIASALPIPQAQMIGRLANVAGRLLADGADEFEAFDELVDGLDDDAIDAAAPVLAGMVIRRAVPQVARAAAPVRRAAVRSVAQAVRTAARRQGPPAARAVARAVTATRRVVQGRGLPPRAAARVVQRAARQVARQPQAVRRLARPLVPAARRVTPRGQAAQVVARTVAPAARRALAATAPRRVAVGGGACPHCRRRITVRGPVTITVRPR